MRELASTCRLALVQAEPVMFDKAAGIDKALSLVAEAAEQGAQLIVFPELFVPGYPIGLTFGYTMGKRTEVGRADWKRYYDASMVEGEEGFCRLSRAAVKAGAYVSMGFSERDATSATLYNSNVVLAPDGTWKVHRKLKPTGTERVVWGDANRGFFPVTDTPWGPIGSLICWESYMPLARVALYQRGVTIYLAPNTNDNEEWQSTVRHIAIEGKCFLVNADMIVRRSSYPKDLAERAAIDALPGVVCRGGSSVVDPFGHNVLGPVWDEEAILYADLNMQTVVASRMEHDPIGHYARPDVLELVVRDG